MPDDIQPVIDPAESKAALSPRLHFLTHAVRVSAGLACLAAVSISVYYFLGFAENDERAAHLMNAYIICFGIGSLFFVPAFFVGRKAHLVLTQGLPKLSRLCLSVDDNDNSYQQKLSDLRRNDSEPCIKMRALLRRTIRMSRSS